MLRVRVYTCCVHVRACICMTDSLRALECPCRARGACGDLEKGALEMYPPGLPGHLSVYWSLCVIRSGGFFE